MTPSHCSDVPCWLRLHWQKLAVPAGVLLVVFLFTHLGGSPWVWNIGG
jgi:hypothetical protein